MARLLSPKGKVVRRLGLNIFGNPKYDRLLKKRPGPPGEIRKRKPRQTEFSRQLLEKQKLKFAYGVSEKQLRNVFARSKSLPGVTGHNMLVLLERRLDNVLFRLGFSVSRNQARQLVSHGHLLLNGRKVTVPSMLVRIGDKIEVRNKKESIELFRKLAAENSGRSIPEWLQREELTSTITMYPTRDMIPTIAEEQQIVELFSK